MVTYSQQHYDLRHKLVSFRFSPRGGGGLNSRGQSAPAIFFARFILSAGGYPRREAFRIVQDFGTQLQYTVSERTGNCTVERIDPRTAVDATEDTKDHRARVKHARDLLQTDPSKFVYAGKVKQTLLGLPKM